MWKWRETARGYETGILSTASDEMSGEGTDWFHGDPDDRRTKRMRNRNEEGGGIGGSTRIEKEESEGKEK